MFTGIFMYCAAVNSKVTYWLLVAALAVQPVTAAVCACDGRGAEAAPCGMEQRCCWAERLGSGERGLRPACCAAGRGEPEAAPGWCACEGCGTSVPATPPAPGAERGPSTDLVVPACCVPAAMIDAHALGGLGRFFRQWLFFASASDHCVALCRWRL